jgi:type I restriction enzyme M protein
LVGDASASVIKQLEHWWDKYHVSLHQLDEQVIKADTVMKEYLLELGYGS